MLLSVDFSCVLKVLLVDADFLPLSNFDELFAVGAPAAIFVPRTYEDEQIDPYNVCSQGIEP